MILDLPWVLAAMEKCVRVGRAPGVGMKSKRDSLGEVFPNYSTPQNPKQFSGILEGWQHCCQLSVGATPGAAFDGGSTSCHCSTFSAS